MTLKAGPSKHPSGLPWHRWHFPFKTPRERAQIQRWLQRQSGDVFSGDPNNPF